MDMTRRRLLGQAGLALAAATQASSALGQNLRATRQMQIGPFYPVQKPADGDANLTRIAGRSGQATGKLIEVSGRVLARNGQPVPGARIEMWQANAVGRYTHKGHRTVEPIDPNFDGFASLIADKDGAYRFLTIQPGAYMAGTYWRAAHLHYLVDGNLNRLITQMYFDADPWLTQDRTLAQDLNQAVGGPVPPTIFGKALGKRADGVERLGFDLILTDG